MIVRTTVGKHDQQSRARVLFCELCGSVTNRGPQSRIVLVVDAPDTSFHLVTVFLVKVLHYIELYVSPSLRSESINGIDISDSLQRLTHQHEAFLLDLDDAASGTRVRLERMTTDCSCG